MGAGLSVDSAAPSGFRSRGGNDDGCHTVRRHFGGELQSHSKYVEFGTKNLQRSERSFRSRTGASLPRTHDERLEIVEFQFFCSRNRTFGILPATIKTLGMALSQSIAPFRVLRYNGGQRPIALRLL